MKRSSNDQKEMQQFLDTVQETSDGLRSFPVSAAADSDQDTITRSASPGGLYIPTRRCGGEVDDDDDVPLALRGQKGVRNVRFTVFPVEMSADGQILSTFDLRTCGGPAVRNGKSKRKQKDEKPHCHQDDGNGESTGTVVPDGGIEVVPNRNGAARQDNAANDCCTGCLVCMMCGGPGCTVQ